LLSLRNQFPLHKLMKRILKIKIQMMRLKPNLKMTEMILKMTKMMRLKPNPKTRKMINLKIKNLMRSLMKMNKKTKKILRPALLNLTKMKKILKQESFKLKINLKGKRNLRKKMQRRLLPFLLKFKLLQ